MGQAPGHAAALDFFDDLFQDYLHGQEVTIANRPDAPLHETMDFILTPGLPVIIGCDNRKHDKGTSELRERLAGILGYTITAKRAKK